MKTEEEFIKLVNITNKLSNEDTWTVRAAKLAWVFYVIKQEKEKTNKDIEIEDMIEEYRSLKEIVKEFSSTKNIKIKELIKEQLSIVPGFEFDSPIKSVSENQYLMTLIESNKIIKKVNPIIEKVKIYEELNEKKSINKVKSIKNKKKI